MLIARCDRCQTAFRISRAQLEACGGKVRCGHCASIFDARVSLHEGASEPVLLGPVELTHVSTVDAMRLAPVSVPAKQTFEPTFDFGTIKPAPRTRGIAWPGPILLFILLIVQLVYHFRADIAFLLPQAKPQLTALCGWLGCEIPLPQQPQLMSIETSDLQADPANPAVMVLSATLRNRAAFAQSLPALELTLTNAQDQPLARRVLWAKDFLGGTVRAEPGFTANTELGVRIFIEAAALKATGYRLYLFFP